LVEKGKTFGRGRAVTFRQGIKRRTELNILIEAVRYTAQPDDFGPDPKCRHELCTL
jgi:hypothetical protein